MIVGATAIGLAGLDTLTLLCRRRIEWWATPTAPPLVRPLTVFFVACNIAGFGLSAAGESPELSVYQSLVAAYWFLMVGYIEGMAARVYAGVRVLLVVAACVQIVGVVYLSSAVFEQDRVELTVALPFAFAGCVWAVVYDGVLYRLPGDTYSALN